MLFGDLSGGEHSQQGEVRRVGRMAGRQGNSVRFVAVVAGVMSWQERVMEQIQEQVKPCLGSVCNCSARKVTIVPRMVKGANDSRACRKASSRGAGRLRVVLRAAVSARSLSSRVTRRPMRYSPKVVWRNSYVFSLVVSRVAWASWMKKNRPSRPRLR
jgi:hypothetical protein